MSDARPSGVSDATLTRLGGQDPTDLSDASTDVLELAGLQLLWSGDAPARLAGRAVTVDTRMGDNAAVRQALDLVSRGDVLVVSGKGYSHRALLGDRLAAVAVNNGVEGFVIDGAVRDVSALADLGVPIFFRSATVLRAIKQDLGRIGRPVAVCGEVVSPGDVVVGTADGLCVVPLDVADLVAASFGDEVDS